MNTFIQDLLCYAPPAALSALIVPEIVVHQGALDLERVNPRCQAGAVTALVARVGGNVLDTIATGMATPWIQQRLL
jgi:branched-subunit amino acid transport protein